METITVRRSGFQNDANGDPKPTGFQDHHTLEANCAPTNSTEPLIVGQNKVIDGFEVYVRGVVADVLSTDRVRIRGVEYSVAGVAGEWLDRDTGELTGTQFATKGI